MKYWILSRECGIAGRLTQCLLFMPIWCSLSSRSALIAARIKHSWCYILPSSFTSFHGEGIHSLLVLVADFAYKDGFLFSL